MAVPTRLIADFLAGPARVRQAVAGLTPEQLRARPVPGRWSTLEVVCHLVDSDQAWSHRIKRVIAEPNPLLIDYDENAFIGSLDYHARDVEEQLMLLEGMRRELARTLETLPESAWSRTGVHSARGVVSLREMVELEISHIAGHLQHVADKLRALGLPVPPAVAKGS